MPAMTSDDFYGGSVGQALGTVAAPAIAACCLLFLVAQGARRSRMGVA